MPRRHHRHPPQHRDRSAPASGQDAAQTRVTARFSTRRLCAAHGHCRPRDLPIQTSLGVVSIVRRAGMEFPQVDRRTVDDVGAPALGFAHLADSVSASLDGLATCAANSRSQSRALLADRARVEPRLVSAARPRPRPARNRSA
jgi:hypothetical protein